MQDLLQSQALPDFSPIAGLHDGVGATYEMSPRLQKAVEIAVHLGLPLLITGEPGTGKTQLAHYLAQRWGLGTDRFFVFHTKSGTAASELFYRYDALGHFQYAQNRGGEPLGPEDVERLFIRYQALGAAIRAKARCLVLIDEVDKAPRDLPNDVLDVMDRLAFEVPEIGRVGNDKYATAPEHRPVVVLTSNSEKNLPDAFLRRCVYHHIEFPDQATLEKIVFRHFPAIDTDDNAAAVEYFLQAREKANRKKPSTAELLHWAEYLRHRGFPFEKLRQPGKLSGAEHEILDAAQGLLFKDKDDLHAAKGR